MQVVDDGAAAEIEEVLAGAAVASTTALPASDVGDGMLDRDALSQLGSALGFEAHASLRGTCLIHSLLRRRNPALAARSPIGPDRGRRGGERSRDGLDRRDVGR